MSVYLVLYHDDAAKNDQSAFDRMKLEEQFSMYNREISNAVIDGGSRILDSKAFTSDGPCSLSNDHISRYLMIEAEDIDEAVELSKNAPLLRGGGRAEVLELSMASY